MSVIEIQTLAQRFADAFDKNDMKSTVELLSEDKGPSLAEESASGSDPRKDHSREPSSC